MATATELSGQLRAVQVALMDQMNEAEVAAGSVAATAVNLQTNAASLLQAIKSLPTNKRRGEVSPATIATLNNIATALVNEAAKLVGAQTTIETVRAVVNVQATVLDHIALDVAALDADTELPPTPPPPSTGVVYAAHDFEDGTLGPFGKFESNGAVSVVGAENGVTPSGKYMVKCVGTLDAGTSAGWAEVNKLLTNNPAHTVEGVYVSWRLCVPFATLSNANNLATGTGAQIKLSLFRVSDEVAANHTPPAYHGLVIACGSTASGNNDIAIAKDNLNIWVANAANAIDGSGLWTKRPKYAPGTWLDVDTWYQTDGTNSQYKLSLNGRLCTHELFTPNTGTNAVVGGAATDTYKARFGIAYCVNRTGVAMPYTVYIDSIRIANTPRILS